MSRLIRSSAKRAVSFNIIKAGERGFLTFTDPGRYDTVTLAMSNCDTDDIEGIEIEYNGNPAIPKLPGSFWRKRMLRLRERDPDTSGLLRLDFRDFGFQGLNNDLQTCANVGPVAADGTQLKNFTIYVTLKSDAAANSSIKATYHRKPALVTEIINGQEVPTGAGSLIFMSSANYNINAGDNDINPEFDKSNAQRRWMRRVWMDLAVDQIEYIELRDGTEYQTIIDPAEHIEHAADLGFTAPATGFLFDPCLDDPNNLIDLHRFNQPMWYAKLKNGNVNLATSTNWIYEFWGPLR